MNITIYDVAREANVSMATVSRVVNGNPNVKPTTRKKVLEAIDLLGYRPNAVARGLASKKTTTVGVIIPDISNTFYAELARGIEDIATMYKYNIILSNSDQNKEKEFHLLNTMLGKQVDGIVFMGEDITDIHVEEFKKSPVPIVLAASFDEQNETSSVNIDYLPLLAGSVLVSVMQLRLRMSMQRRWRAWLNHRLLDRWLRNRVCYQLDLIGGPNRNPEGRIANFQAQIATEAPVELAIGLTTAVLSAATFIAVLWTVGGAFTVEIASVVITVPGFLVVAAAVCGPG